VWPLLSAEPAKFKLRCTRPRVMDDDDGFLDDRYEEEEALIEDSAVWDEDQPSECFGTTRERGLDDPCAERAPKRPYVAEAEEEVEDVAETAVARKLEFQNSVESPSKRARLMVSAETDEPFLFTTPLVGKAMLPVVLPISGRSRFLELRVPEQDADVSSRRANWKAGEDTKAIDTLLTCVQRAREEQARKAASEPPTDRESSASVPRSESEKWTDRYAPKAFHHLLSSERVNRNVLTWVKMWGKHMDEAVRGTTKSQSVTRLHGGKPSASSSSGGGGGGTSKAGAGVTEQVMAQRSELRDLFGPDWNIDSKVLLLAGPAGIGKTVLAHMAAKQARMEVIELNASDDRSAGRLESRLQSMMQMQSITAKGRHRMVILDEVDGLDQGAVELLVKMIQATPPVVPTTYRWTAPRSKRGAIPLTCPVICTCNDVFASALRSLREHVQIIEMQRPAPTRLHDLLKTICRDQHITPTQEGLSLLAERCGNDIRGCINTLHAIPLRHSKAIGMHKAFRLAPDVVLQLPIGAKDDTRSSFDVWASVFAGHHSKRLSGVIQNAPTASDAAKAAVQAAEAVHPDSASVSLSSLNLNTIEAVLNQGASSSTAPGARGAWTRRGARSYTRFLLHDLASRGVDVDLLVDGLFENHPSVPHTDPNYEDQPRAADWLSCADLFTTRAQRMHQYSLLGMASVCGAAVHWLSASDRPGQRIRPRWPSQLRRMRSDQRCKEDVLEDFVEGRMRRGAGLGSRNGRTIVLDVLSPLISISSPPLRARNTGLLNSRERMDMADAVSVMATNGLVYALAKPTMGESFDDHESPHFALKPPIDGLVRYEGYDPFDPSFRRETADVMKELLSQEVRLAMVRLREQLTSLGNGDDDDGGGGGGGSDSEGEEASESVAEKLQLAMSGARRSARSKHTQRVALPEHVKRQIEEASGVSPSVKVEILPESDLKPVKVGMMHQFRKHKPSSAPSAVAALPKKVFPVRFRYLEGYSNAVRRPVTLGDLLA
jgi:DNA polymerase III delta prime subunit